jgi:hypothetical protein
MEVKRDYDHSTRNGKFTPQGFFLILGVSPLEKIGEEIDGACS